MKSTRAAEISIQAVEPVSTSPFIQGAVGAAAGVWAIEKVGIANEVSATKAPPSHARLRIDMDCLRPERKSGNERCPCAPRTSASRDLPVDEWCLNAPARRTTGTLPASHRGSPDG